MAVSIRQGEGADRRDCFGVEILGAHVQVGRFRAEIDTPVRSRSGCRSILFTSQGSDMLISMPAPRRWALARPSFLTLGLWYGLCFGPAWLTVVSLVGLLGTLSWMNAVYNEHIRQLAPLAERDTPKDTPSHG